MRVMEVWLCLHCVSQRCDCRRDLRLAHLRFIVLHLEPLLAIARSDAPNARQGVFEALKRHLSQCYFSPKFALY